MIGLIVNLLTANSWCNGNFDCLMKSYVPVMVARPLNDCEVLCLKFFLENKANLAKRVPIMIEICYCLFCEEVLRLKICLK